MSKCSAYLIHSKANLYTYFAYSFEMWGFVLFGLFQIILSICVWISFFASSGATSINGFTLEEMIQYVFISQMVILISANNADNMISSDISSGNIVYSLMRPQSYILGKLFNQVGHLMFHFVFVIIPFWFLLSFIGKLQFNIDPASIERIFITLLSAFLSFFLSFFINIFIGLIAFKLMNNEGVLRIKSVIIMFLSGGLIPISYFPDSMKSIVINLPFASMVSVPTNIYLGKYNSTNILDVLLLQVTWVIVFIISSFTLYIFSIRRLSVNGS